MEKLVFNCVEKRLKDYRENHSCTKREHILIDELLQSVADKERSLIDLFLSLGHTTRHRIMNMVEYMFMQKFEFNEIRFDEYDWIVSDYFVEKETVEFRVKEDKACCNNITIACGKNGVWTYGINYTHGYAGGVSGASVFGARFSSKKEVIDAAVKDMIEKHRKALQSADKDSCGNFRVPYINAVLKCIEKYKGNQQAVQLELF